MNYYPYGKRLLDLILLGAIVLLMLLTAPLLLIFFAVLLVAHADGPLFFSQIRAGLHNRPFRIYKFRTLKVNNMDRLSMGHVRHNHSMATPIGQFLRRLKIDELPQLWNILLGEMSFIGPRPVYLEMTAEYTSEQAERLHVLPGLTGWSQINGNCELTWDERIRLDLWYVDHLSFWLDLKILAATVGVLSQGELINQDALAQADSYLEIRQEDQHACSRPSAKEAILET
ncbi:MAG: sugar transferase [Chloroflexota bacterium]